MSQAKMIPDAALDRLLDDVARDSRAPRRDLVIVLLSCKGALRACEVAGLTWRDVSDVSGNLTNEIVIPAAIAKKGHMRVVPMHPLLREALEILREAQTEASNKGLCAKPTGKTNVVLSVDGFDAMSPNNLAQFLGRLYRRHGLDATSHSGRRTVITKLARMANEHGCSLFDVQKVAGHKGIESTEAYVVHSDGVHRMMEAL